MCAIRFQVLTLSALLASLLVIPAWAKETAAARADAATKGAYARDAARDRSSKVKTNGRDRTVYRYTTKEQAEREKRQGIAPNSHMAPGNPGRPLSKQQATTKYGIREGHAEVRETIRLPKGQPVKNNKTIGGQPGVGELTSPKPVGPERISNTVQLRDRHPKR